MDITMKKKVDKTVIVYCKSGKMTLNIQDCNTYHSNNPIPHNERLYKFFDKCGNIRNDGYVVSYTQTDLVSKVGTGGTVVPISERCKHRVPKQKEKLETILRFINTNNLQGTDLFRTFVV